MPGLQQFGSWRHLATRFAGALSPHGPGRADERWALDALLPGEQELWRRMSGPDRRHAIGVARDTAKLLGTEQPDRAITAAALLHDVGKVESGFGTFSRVGITVAAVAAGRFRVVEWAASEAGGRGRRGTGRRRTLRRRVGLYLTHDQLGAALLERAGSQPLTCAWAGEHHLPEDKWTVDARVGTALKQADGD